MKKIILSLILLMGFGYSQFFSTDEIFNNVFDAGNSALTGSYNSGEAILNTVFDETSGALRMRVVGGSLNLTSDGDTLKFNVGTELYVINVIINGSSVFYVDTTGNGYFAGTLIIDDGDLDLNNTATNHLLLPLNNDAVTPTLAFGDGDSGFYQGFDNTVYVSIGGANRWRILQGQIYGEGVGAGALLNEASTSTNPTLVPYRGDWDTGIGGNNADQLSLIADAREIIRATGGATQDTVTVTADVSTFSGNVNIAGTLNVVGSNTPEAEMYFDANAVATVIETANTPIALRNFTTGKLNKWTYNVGSTGAITAFADYGVAAGDTVTVSSATHGLITGDIISIRGTTNYNGIWEVGYIGVGSFYIIDTWVADDGASDWDEGDYLLAGASAAGDYEAPWGLSASEGGAAGSTVLYCLYVNTTQQDKTRMPRKFANNDVGSFGCPLNLTTTISAGDRVFMTANSTGTNTVTNGYGGVILKKL